MPDIKEKWARMQVHKKKDRKTNKLWLRITTKFSSLHQAAIESFLETDQL